MPDGSQRYEEIDLPITPEIKRRNRTQTSKLPNDGIEYVISWWTWSPGYSQWKHDKLLSRQTQFLEGALYTLCKLDFISFSESSFLPPVPLWLLLPIIPQSMRKKVQTLHKEMNGFILYIQDFSDQSEGLQCSMSKFFWNHPQDWEFWTENCNLQSELLTRLKFSVLKSKLLVYMWLLCAKHFLTIL